MPELPEVETVRRQLHRHLAGATIVSLEILRSGREFPAGRAFVEGLTGARISGIKRRGKLLIWELDQKRFLFAHLKMTGKFLIVPDSYLCTKHDRILFVYRSKRGEKKRLVWSDMRQFGYVKLLPRKEGERILEAYGLEPLTTSVGLLVARLAQPTGRAIKTVLLDQTVIAGIGNIYADEACFRARIRPTHLAKRLTEKDRLRLAKAIKEVLSASLAQKGTSAHHYVDTAGEKGGFLACLQVYGRGQKPCVHCGTRITRLVFRGRSTHFCSSCQR